MLLDITSTILIVLIINFILINTNTLVDLNKKFEHKQLIKKTKTVPLSGGLIIFMLINYFSFQDYLFLLLTLSILILGITSDIDFLRSPKKRIFFQTIIIIIFLISSNIYFTDLRLNQLNVLLDYYPFVIIFNAFCILILINGTNLIDGLNNSVIGYFISIGLILTILSNNYDLIFDKNLLSTILIVLSIIYVFNFFGKLYLGDGGSYLLSFIFAIILIKYYINNPSLSPYFIMCLLWYPAFENLFSITRKKLSNISHEIPDKKHLHHYLFRFFERKLNFNKEFINSLTGNIIVAYNFLYFLIIKDYYFYTLGLIISTLFNIIIYIFLYFMLSKKY